MSAGSSEFGEYLFEIIINNLETGFFNYLFVSSYWLDIRQYINIYYIAHS